jgi:hypothetical protein
VFELSCDNGTLDINVSDRLQHDHWQFNKVKEVTLAQYSKKQEKVYNLSLEAEVTTSKKSRSGVKTIGVFVYQHKKRYLIRLPFSHSLIRWIGTVINETAKYQKIIDNKVYSNKYEIFGSKPDEPNSNEDKTIEDKQ